MSINQKIQPGSFVLNNGHDILKKTSVDVSALSSLTQSALDDILAQLPHQGRINFSQVLEEKGYSSYMSGIRFNARWADKLHIDFSDCQFDHVKFTGKIVNATFGNLIRHSYFDQAQISHSVFEQANIQNSVFLETEFKFTPIQNSTVNQTWFINDKFVAPYIQGNLFEKTIWLGVELTSQPNARHGIYENQFQGAELINSFLPNTIDQDEVQTLKLEKPVVGVVSFSDWFVPATEAITANGGEPKGIIPGHLQFLAESLEWEVKLGIAQYHKEAVSGDVSIPQFLLKQDSYAINVIKAYAKNAMNNVDGLWIPGDGDDIHPEFYNQPLDPKSTSTADTYVKEMLEFALIAEALDQQKPLMGVCHGSQIVNVYLGGSLMQSLGAYVKQPSISNEDELIAYFRQVGMAEYIEKLSEDKIHKLFKAVQEELANGSSPGHFGSQHLDVHKPTGLVGVAMKDGIDGVSMHSQAMDKVADELEVVATYQKITKAVQAIDGRPILLTQFHPEYMGSEPNTQIVKNFVDSVAKSQLLKYAIKLSDVVEIDDSLVENLAVHFRNDGFHYESECSAEPVMVSELANPFIGNHHPVVPELPHVQEMEVLV